MAVKRRVFYIFDKKLKDATDNIRNIKLRSAVVHTLIKSYHLLEKCVVCPITLASEQDLLSFHSALYVDYLKKAQESSDLEKVTEGDEAAAFNLEYDCPLFENIYDFVRMVAGGTLTATSLICPQEVPKENVNVLQNDKPKSYLKFQDSKQLADKSNVYDLPGDLTLDEERLEEMTSPRLARASRMEVPDVATEAIPPTSQRASHQLVALNWFGGWHHAQRDSAEGFCYVNDIVIGIQHLLKFYKRVLYVDLDVHHGNGVENAFAHTPHVMTVSFHKHGVGFYPGTGAVQDVGIGPGMNYAVNVPLLDGITDGPYMQLFSKIMTKVHQVYQPDCIVVQCGADSLSGDPLGGLNLSLRGYGFCVQHLLDWGLPTTLLGGGGYNVANAARCYAHLTAIALGERISSSIPENNFFHLFGPGFELDISRSLRKDENTESSTKAILDTVLNNLNKINY